MYLATSLVLSSLKLLFMPSYKSTDFEVHRNWLAITSSLPVSKWYLENTSIWTLDYPPLFAWFEFIISKVAVYFDPEMLRVGNLDYSSENTILFQRLSVIVTDLVFLAGAIKCSNNLQLLKLGNIGGVSKDTTVFFLLLSNFGLFLVDHIHFQYNGFLFGILLLSIAALMEEQYLLGGFWFAVLLNLKHIYLYIAPAYFIFLLRSYCFINRPKKTLLFNFSPMRLISLGSLVLFIFGLSFGPFIHQIEAVVHRLFPFKRGLCHAYWAPNFWAVYNIADKVLTVAGKKTGYLNTTVDAGASMTGGLVQDIQHTVLPSIPPTVTFALTFLSMIPALYKLWRSPNNVVAFIRCLTLCGWSSFIFGWHVHEKAIIIVIIPLTILAVISKQESRYFVLLSNSGHFSLFPLLFTQQELLSKMFLFIFSTSLNYKLIKQVYKGSLFCKKEVLYLLLAIPVFLYAEFLHHYLGFAERLPFLPLMLYSLYSTVGVLVTYIRFYAFFLYQ